jgi:tetratricopeptide (TPR) repeat protein
LIETDEVENAMNLIRKFISFNPDSSEGFFLLAKICEKQGNYKDSYDYLTQAIEHAPNAQYYLTRGIINYQLKDYKKSINNLKMANKLPKSEKISNLVGDYLIKNYLKINDLISAQIHLNKKVSLDKNRIMYKYNLYVLYKKQGNEKRALELSGEIKKFKPTALQDYVDLSEIYLEEGKFEQANKILERANKKFPKNYFVNSQKNKLKYLNN